MPRAGNSVNGQMKNEHKKRVAVEQMEIAGRGRKGRKRPEGAKRVAKGRQSGPRGVLRSGRKSGTAVGCKKDDGAKKVESNHYEINRLRV